MKSVAIAPLFTTQRLTQTREFYTSYLGFEVALENDLYLGLRLPESSLALDFMPTGPGQPAASGRGLLYCFAVEDIDAEYESLRALGAHVSAELRRSLEPVRSAIAERRRQGFD